MEDAVAGSRASQNKIELQFVLDEVAKINPQIIVEIGAWRGYSMEVWKNAFNPKILIGVENDETVIDKELRRKFEKENITIIVGDSHSITTQIVVAGAFGNGLIDFLFIDGDHTFEGVKRDYELYSPFMRKGGIIGFHDIALNEQKWIDAGVEVCRFWQHLKDHGAKTKEIHDPISGTGTGLLYI